MKVTYEKISRSEIEKLVSILLKRKGYREVYSVSFSKIEEGKFLFSILGDKIEKESTAKKVQSAPVISRIKVTVNDTIRLKAKTVDGERILDRFGEWWMIKPFAIEDKWYLSSLPLSKLGKFKGKNQASKLNVMWLIKDSDPNFEIIDVCSFPKKFNHKEYDK